jgi:hypothetical protein
MQGLVLQLQLTGVKRIISIVNEADALIHVKF